MNNLRHRLLSCKDSLLHQLFLPALTAREVYIHLTHFLVRLSFELIVLSSKFLRIADKGEAKA
jgi:hypothetical protein